MDSPRALRPRGRLPHRQGPPTLLQPISAPSPYMQNPVYEPVFSSNSLASRLSSLVVAGPSSINSAHSESTSPRLIIVDVDDIEETDGQLPGPSNVNLPCTQLNYAIAQDDIRTSQCYNYPLAPNVPSTSTQGPITRARNQNQTMQPTLSSIPASYSQTMSIPSTLSVANSLASLSTSLAEASIAYSQAQASSLLSQITGPSTRSRSHQHHNAGTLSSPPVTFPQITVTSPPISSSLNHLQSEPTALPHLSLETVTSLLEAIGPPATRTRSHHNVVEPMQYPETSGITGPVTRNRLAHLDHAAPHQPTSPTKRTRKSKNDPYAPSASEAPVITEEAPKFPEFPDPYAEPPLVHEEDYEEEARIELNYKIKHYGPSTSKDEDADSDITEPHYLETPSPKEGSVMFPTNEDSDEEEGEEVDRKRPIIFGIESRDRVDQNAGEDEGWNTRDNNKLCNLVMHSVISGLKSVFDVFGDENVTNTEIANATQSLVSSYRKIVASKIPSAKVRFVDEFVYRMSLMMEKLDCCANRQRVLRVMAKVARCVWKEHGGQVLTSALVEHIVENCHADSEEVRANCCCMAGCLLAEDNDTKPSQNTEEGASTEDVHGDPFLDGGSRLRVARILADRFYDRACEVRLEVVWALSVIQFDEVSPAYVKMFDGSPEELLAKFTLDRDPQCRRAAILSLDTKTSKHLDPFVAAAVTDSDVDVRKAAIRQLAQLDFDEMSEETRFAILTGTVTDYDEEISLYAVHVLLSVWLRHLTDKYKASKQRGSRAVANDTQCLVPVACKLLQSISYENDLQKSRRILIASFRILRKSLKFPGVNLEDFVSELIDSTSTEDGMISAHNMESLLLRKGKTNKSRLVLIFFWRTLILFCSKSSYGEVDTLSCMFRLCPSLLTTCNIMNSCIKDALDKKEAGFTSAKEMILEMLGVLRKMDKTDPIGLESYRSLLEDLLLSRSKAIGKRVIEVVFCDVYNFFYKQQSAVPHLMNVIRKICDKQTVDHGGAVISTEEANAELALETHHHVLSIINSAMKTGRFKKENSRLRQIIEKFVIPTYTSQETTDDSAMHQEMRDWAVEIVGIMCLADANTARDQTSYLRDVFMFGYPELQGTILKVLTDMVVLYSYDTVNQWYTVEVEYPPGVNLPLLTNSLADAFNTGVAIGDIAVDSVICCCKVLLHEPRSEFLSVLAMLLMRLHQKTDSDTDDLKACIFQFLMIFTMTSRSNQAMIVEAFVKMTTSHLASPQNMETLEFTRMCVTFMQITAYDWCSEKDKEHVGSVQPELLEHVFPKLQQKLSAKYIIGYAKMCSLVSFEGFSEEQLNRAKQLAAEHSKRLSSLPAASRVQVQSAIMYLSRLVSRIEREEKRRRGEETGEEEILRIERRLDVDDSDEIIDVETIEGGESEKAEELNWAQEMSKKVKTLEKKARQNGESPLVALTNPEHVCSLPNTSMSNLRRSARTSTCNGKTNTASTPNTDSVVSSLQAAIVNSPSSPHIQNDQSLNCGSATMNAKRTPTRQVSNGIKTPVIVPSARKRRLGNVDNSDNIQTSHASPSKKSFMSPTRQSARIRNK